VALSTVVFDRVDKEMAEAQGNPAALPGALTDGFELALYLGAGLAAIGAVITLLAITARDARKPQTGDEPLDARPAPQHAGGRVTGASPQEAGSRAAWRSRRIRPSLRGLPVRLVNEGPNVILLTLHCLRQKIDHYQ
jgi:hypothetical protein